jgi:hypothetical protein
VDDPIPQTPARELDRLEQVRIELIALHCIARMIMAARRED